MGKSLGRERNFEEGVLTVNGIYLEKMNFGYQGGVRIPDSWTDDRKALLPSDSLHFGMEKQANQKNRVETECSGNERLL